MTALADRVLEVRRAQLALNDDLLARRYGIPVHLAVGHEAVAVALCAAAEPSDQIALTHRNVAYHLARGASLEQVRAEYALEASGLAGGRLGSMNLMDPVRGLVYTSSILGNNLPVACGLALANQTAGKGRAVFALTGDGALEEGAFHEALIFARSHALPVIFVVENNDHSLASRIHERRCPVRLDLLSAASAIPYRELTGNDPGRYLAAFTGARREALERGPVLVEARVKTYCNHAGPTPGWPADPKRLDTGRGLVIEENADDPAWVATELLGSGRDRREAA